MLLIDKLLLDCRKILVDSKIMVNNIKKVKSIKYKALKKTCNGRVDSKPHSFNDYILRNINLIILVICIAFTYR